MKPGVRVAVYACVLMLLTLSLLTSAWGVYTLIDDGLSAQMMGFEQEPAQGRAYWHWYFLKRNMGGILGTAGIFLVFGAIVTWGWIAAIRDFRRK